MQNNVGIYASQISGHLWAPNGAYDALATVTVPSGGLASITFAGIPQGYKHLQIRGICLSSSSNNGIAARFNGDSASNYGWHGLEGNGVTTTVQAYSAASQSYAAIGYTGDATYPSSFICDILDYSSNTKNKVTETITGNDANASATRYVSFLSGRWLNTAPITSITITHGAGVNLNEYSQIALYGVK